MTLITIDNIYLQGIVMMYTMSLFNQFTRVYATYVYLLMYIPSYIQSKL